MLEQGTLPLIMPNDFLGPTLEEVQVWLRSSPDSARAGFVLSSLGDSATVLAGNRGLDVKRLVQLLAGDLDWVVMKALDKDRDRRYDTPGRFAEDIEHYLADETVEARPASAGYRLRKILRRNKGPVVAASLIFLALVGGVIGTTLGLFEAKRHEGEAKRQERLAVAAQKQEALRADSEAKLAKENGLLAQSERDASALARNNQKIAERQGGGTQAGPGAELFSTGTARIRRRPAEQRSGRFDAGPGDDEARESAVRQLPACAGRSMSSGGKAIASASLARRTGEDRSLQPGRDARRHGQPGQDGPTVGRQHRRPFGKNDAT